MRRTKTIGAACALATLASATAQAGTTSWTTITPGLRNTNELGLARTADGVLHVAYGVKDGDEKVVHTSIPASGVGVGAPVTIAALPTINDRVALVREPGGGLRAFYGGLLPIVGNLADLGGFLRTSTSGPLGTAWSVPVPASRAIPPGISPVYAAAGVSATVGADGVPVAIWGDSNGTGAGFHVGVMLTDADTPLGATCCDIDPNVAVDASTRQTIAAWTSLGSSATFKVGPLGGPTSSPPGGLTPTTQDRAPLTGRISAPGVLLGGLADGRPALWQVGTSMLRRVPGQAGARHVGVAAAPDGRVWLFWLRKGRLYASRTNPAATRLGAIRSVTLPSGTAYRTAGEGSLGPLDALVAIGKSPSWQHRRILPGLSVTVPPSIRQGASMTVKVTDAGVAIGSANVRVKVGAATLSATTASSGRVKLKIRSGTSATTAIVIAAKPGYGTARTKVKIAR